MIYVVNQKGAVSRFSLTWVGVVDYRGVIYGLTSTDLVMLSGPAESTTTPYVETGKLQPLGGQEYNMPKATLGLSGTGDAAITTITNEHGVSQVNERIVVPLSEELDQYEVMLGTANVARSYVVRLELPADGKALTADLYMNPVRHRRA